MERDNSKQRSRERSPEENAGLGGLKVCCYEQSANLRHQFSPPGLASLCVRTLIFGDLGFVVDVVVIIKYQPIQNHPPTFLHSTNWQSAPCRRRAPSSQE